MTAPSHLGALLYEEETSFGESASMSSPGRLNILGEIDVSGLTWEKQDLGNTRQYRNEKWFHVLGPKGGSVTVTLPLSGHGSATTGSLTETTLADFLSYVFGNNSAASTGTTVNDVSATASSFDVTATTGAASGALYRAGELGDGAAEGQPFVLESLAGSTFTLATALPAAPADSDAIYAMETVYPHESGTSGTAVTGLRLEFRTADQQYLCHGCFATGARLTGLNTGELPRVEVDLQVAWWEPVANTFPATESVQSFAPPCVAAGSFFYNENGTATRQTAAIRDFSISINIDVVPIRGPGGADSYQAVIAAHRRMVGATCSFTVDSESATTTPTWLGVYDDDPNTDTRYQFLYGMSVVDGSSLALYMPGCVMTSPVPVQRAADGMQRVQTIWECQTNPDTSTATTDLHLSAFRLGIG